MKKDNMFYLAILGGLGLLAYFLLKNRNGTFWGGGGGVSDTVILPPPGTIATPEPLPTPINTTINLYNQLPAENKLSVPGSGFVWQPYTESGKLTVYPIVPESLIKLGVTQKYVPATQLITPQAKMLMTLSQKLTPAVTYNTGKGVMLPPKTLFQTLQKPLTTVLANKIQPKTATKKLPLNVIYKRLYSDRIQTVINTTAPRSQAYINKLDYLFARIGK